MYRKMFTLSFDDGTVQDRRLIELFDKYHLRATFNLNSGFFGQKHRIVHEGIDVCHDEIEISEAAQLYRNHEIAVHTVTHPNLRCIKDDSELIAQVEDDRKALEALCGKEIVGMAYPCGGNCYDERVIRLITESTPIRYARTTSSTGGFALPESFMAWHPTCHQNANDLMELAERFIADENEGDTLFYLWGHSFEFDKFQSWERFEKFCKFISRRREITYMTNGEVYRYLSKKNNI